MAELREHFRVAALGKTKGVTQLIKIWIKQAIGSVVFGLGLHRMILGSGAVIVAFHRVWEHGEKSSINCSPSEFSKYCRFFKKYFDVVPLSEIVRRVQGDEDLSGLLAITFDDGYEDNATVASKILTDLELPATFFITTNFIGSEVQTFWDIEEGVESKWMSWDQVRDLSEAGFDIGGHSENHLDLTSVGIDEAKREIHGCRKSIENQIGETPRHFAFPFGAMHQVNDNVRELVQRAGFKSCVSCCGGGVESNDRLFDLAREPITSWHRSPQHFGFEILQRSRQRKIDGQANSHL